MSSKHVILIMVMLLGGFFVTAQEMPLSQKAIKESNNYTWEGNKELSEGEFVNAEANYRRAISKSEGNVAAPFNLGNAYYDKESYAEAFGRYKQAGERAQGKIDKHLAYHNLGNVAMKNKDYSQAVEAYKEALRNNPSDEETRYNLALAQEMLKKEQEQQQDQNQENDQENQDQEQDQKNQQDQNQGDQEENEGDQKEEGDQDQKDQGDEGDKGDQEPKDNQEGEGDQEKQDKKPQQGGQPEERKSQLSPQQIQNLLEAMQNEERKVQEKMDAKKVKGAKVKTEKDW